MGLENFLGTSQARKKKVRKSEKKVKRLSKNYSPSNDLSKFFFVRQPIKDKSGKTISYVLIYYRK